MNEVLVAIAMAASAAHQPSVAVSRLPALVDAARTYCPEPQGKGGNGLTNDEKMAVQSFEERMAFDMLKLSPAERATVLGMCVLYRQGRSDELREGINTGADTRP